MATAGSAERPARPASAAADTSRCGSGPGPGAGCRSGSSPPEDEAKKCPACADVQPGGSPARGHPACPLCLARRHSGSEERLRRRSDPERSSSGPGRGDGDSRKDFFISPALVLKSADVSGGPTGRHKVSCDNETRRRICRDETGSVRHPQEPGVLSDSENEEPISRRIRNISAFIRKTKNSSAFSSGSQRSRSCTDPVEDRGGKMKLVTPLAAMLDGVGISHVFSAGILLSSENSRSLSAPVVTAPDRRPAWRAVLTPWSSSTPLVVPPPRPERSVSPESNDSISEELNHFKPIVCSPCTPPKRLPDGRLLEPAIVKSTPRNLTRGLQRATSYEASPAVLQKWRQIELDRENLRVTSKATLTSPVTELSVKEGGRGVAKNRQTSDGVMSLNKRKLLFEAEQAVKIRVPAIRYSSEAAFRGRSDCEPASAAFGESCSGAAPLGRKQSFSPYAKNSSFQSCHQVPKESPKKESENQSTSRRGQKKNQKTKHLDSDLRRTRAAGQDQIQQERCDRALAMKLQRQFDLENQTAARRRSPDTYFLRSWRSNQNRRRRGLRRSRRINKKH